MMYTSGNIIQSLIEKGELVLYFGSIENIDEVTLEDKGHKGVKILVRNRIKDGINGAPIPHPTPTIKYIKGNTFKYDGMLGVPIEFTNDEIKFYKDADNKYNRENMKSVDWKIINTFIEENKDDLIEYWYADPKLENEKLELIEDNLKKNFKKMKK